VITEQPTASSKLKLDLLLASADIITQPLTQQPHQQRQEQEQHVEVESAAPVAGTSPNQTIQPENPEPETITIYVPPNPPATSTNHSNRKVKSYILN